MWVAHSDFFPKSKSLKCWKKYNFILTKPHKPNLRQVIQVVIINDVMWEQCIFGKMSVKWPLTFVVFLSNIPNSSLTTRINISGRTVCWLSDPILFVIIMAIRSNQCLKICYTQQWPKETSQLNAMCGWNSGTEKYIK